MLRMGIHACAMGEGGMRREPKRRGREDVSTGTSGPRAKGWLPSHFGLSHRCHCHYSSAVLPCSETPHHAAQAQAALTLHNTAHQQQHLRLRRVIPVQYTVQNSAVCAVLHAVLHLHGIYRTLALQHCSNYCVFHNAVTIRSAKKNDSRSRSADFGLYFRIGSTKPI
jgi:hypothetical protein